MDKTHGGKRVGAGRPMIGEERMCRVSVSIGEEDARYLLRLSGSNNASLGLRRIVAEHRTQNGVVVAAPRRRRTV